MKMLRLLLAIAAIHLTFAQAQDALPSSPEPRDKKVTRSRRDAGIYSRRMGHTHALDD